MKNVIFQVNQEVKRVQPGDYTDGRIGTVLELDLVKNRARVLWHTSGTGAKMKPIKTWVKFSCLVIK